MTKARFALFPRTCRPHPALAAGSLAFACGQRFWWPLCAAAVLAAFEVIRFRRALPRAFEKELGRRHD